MKAVGQFTHADGIFSGPLDYIEEQGNALLDKILAGAGEILTLTQGQSPDSETAILVRLQTDYAGWLGLKQAEG